MFGKECRLTHIDSKTFNSDERSKSNIKMRKASEVIRPTYTNETRLSQVKHHYLSPVRMLLISLTYTIQQ